MCGICGIFDFEGEPVDRALLGRMIGRIRHRGPDGWSGRRVFAVPCDDRGPHGRVRRRRDHAAQEHMVRAKAPGWVAGACHLENGPMQKMHKCKNAQM